MQKLFSYHERQEKLTRIEDVLDKLNQLVDWEQFRPTLESCYTKQDADKPGRRRTDLVLMFKIFILQKYYNLSDDRTEYMILDRLSFMRFLNLTLDDPVPDAKTIWKIRNELNKAGVLDVVFIELINLLREKNIILTEGKIVDASIMQSKVSRKKKRKNKNSNRQIDEDAGWCGHKEQFGYKNHVKIDKESKMIENFETSPANEADTEYFECLLEGSDVGQDIYADKGYPSQRNDKALRKVRARNKIMKKKPKGEDLSDYALKLNKKISKKRARIEHLFGWMKRGQTRYLVRARSLLRATAEITLLNITYNLFNLTRLGKAI